VAAIGDRKAMEVGLSIRKKKKKNKDAVSSQRAKMNLKRLPSRMETPRNVIALLH